jgi:hypothetical protein
MVCFARLKWCQTDLGANVFNWPRLVAENRRFGTLAAESGGLTADNFDGVLVQKLVSQGKYPSGFLCPASLEISWCKHRKVWTKALHKVVAIHTLSPDWRRVIVFISI